MGFPILLREFRPNLTPYHWLRGHAQADPPAAGLVAVPNRRSYAVALRANIFGGSVELFLSCYSCTAAAKCSQFFASTRFRRLPKETVPCYLTITKTSDRSRKRQSRQIHGIVLRSTTDSCSASPLVGVGSHCLSTPADHFLFADKTKVILTHRRQLLNNTAK